jgi:aspartate/methionine/tyrosine aminotransferase
MKVVWQNTGGEGTLLLMPPRPFSLERYFARFEFTTRYLLSSSDCEAFTVPELLDLAETADRDAYHHMKLGYTESNGLPQLRELVAQQLGVSREDVVIAAPEEAIYLTMRSLLQPGDRIITTFPGYQSLYELASSIGCRVERWTPEETATGWCFDPETLDAIVKPGVRAVVVNFPHNTTGAVLEIGEWRRVQAIANRVGACLISDEMYRGLEQGTAMLPSAASAGGQSVSIGGLSKSFGLPGLRIGWVATQDADLLRGIQHYHDYTTICNSAPSERLAVIALKNATKLQERCRSIVARHLPLAESFFKRQTDRFSWRRPAGGPVTLVRFHPGNTTVFCEEAARRAGIMLVPSSIFEWGDHHIRLGLGRTNFPEALEALERYLATEQKYVNSDAR